MTSPIREFTAALALGPTDRAAAHCDLGESLLAKGRKADAKREALAALEIAPSFERAQELLLKSIQSGQGRAMTRPGATALPLAAAAGLARVAVDRRRALIRQTRRWRPCQTIASPA